MIYLASPYSHIDPEIRRQRYLLTMSAQATLMRDKLHIYSPIVHCHELAVRYELPYEAAFWQEYNEDFIKRSDAIYNLCIDGWTESKGMAAERKFAKTLPIPEMFVIVGANSVRVSEKAP